HPPLVFLYPHAKLALVQGIIAIVDQIEHRVHALVAQRPRRLISDHELTERALVSEKSGGEAGGHDMRQMRRGGFETRGHGAIGASGAGGRNPHPAARKEAAWRRPGSRRSASSRSGTARARSPARRSRAPHWP